MKKIIIAIIIILLIALAGYFFYTPDTLLPDNIETTATSDSNEIEVFRPDPSNAAFIFDDGEITLSNGRNERRNPPESAFVEETLLLDKFAYGDINADGKEDAIVFLARYGSGSGTFIYLAAFVSGPVTYRGTRVTYLGDRISPQSISINEGIVTVKYLDRRPDEALAVEPTVRMTKEFTFEDGGFQER